MDRVLFFSPAFPAEMPLFCRGLAEVGAPVVGLGDTPEGALPDELRRCLADYVQVPRLFDEEDVVARVRRYASRHELSRIECLWEPGMMLAARLREDLGLPGMTVAETRPFRDKEEMKLVLDRAGIRTPRHRKASTEPECRLAAEELGYPLIVKPIAGAGSADTYRLDAAADLERVLPRIRHVETVSVEEFVDGEELTFDTICHDREIAYFNISWYRPKPLLGRSLEWMSPQTVALRDVGRPDLAPGREMGRRVLEALSFRTGFTHMEWFLRPDGEAVFGEIGARPPGARSVAIMNWTGGADLYRGWAEAVTRKRFSQPTRRTHNAAVIFKRASGEGTIRRIAGLEGLLRRYGPHIVEVDLLPIGARRRDWKQTLLSDGFVIVRHPDLASTLEMADRVGTDLRLLAA
ncbi:MAG: ATP-grasp domain-containing protein [Thermoanaerobaculia bacterium]